MALPAAAGAAERIYWSDYDAGKISWANVDGSGGGVLPTLGATMNGPMGMTLDPAAGRVYWANWGPSDDPGHTIAYANLDGSGGGTLPIPQSIVDGPHGLAIDPAAGRIYWPNFNGDSIGWYDLDGSGSGLLNTGSAATVSGPRGVAIDPSAGRIYWANHGADEMGTTISYAALDGSGRGGDLITSGPPMTIEGPEGVAIDPVTRRIYWGNYSVADSIAYASLSGGPPHQLNTTGATTSLPHGVALDPVSRRIYWPNFNNANNPISWAALNGGGGRDLATPGASRQRPVLPALLDAPKPFGAPVITDPTGGKGTSLHCGRGAWAPDALSSLLYRAPRSFSYRWDRDGAEIPGASADTIEVDAGGSYRCDVSARNAAGSASQASAVYEIPSNAFKLAKLKRNKRKGTAKLTVKIPGPGKLKLARSKKLRGDRERDKGGRAKLAVKPRGSAAKKLERRGRAKVKLTVTYTPDGGPMNAKAKRIKLIQR